MIVLLLLYFFFLTLVLFYLPGRYLLRYVHQNLFGVSVFSLSFSIGICLFISGIYFFSWTGYPAVFLMVPLILALLEVRKSVSEVGRARNVIKKSYRELLLIIFGSACMLVITGFSGRMVGDQMVFYGSNATDSIFHLGLIGNLTHSFPPMHSALSGIPLSGYHFFYDFLIATFVRFFHIPSLDAFFRLFPLLLSLLYGISGWSIGKFYGLKGRSLFTLLFLLYFSQGIAYFFLGFLGISHHTYDPGLTQGLLMIINPSLILSTTLLFSVIPLLFTLSSLRGVLLSSLILGVVIEIKIYTFILAIVALLITGIIQIIFKKKPYLFLSFLFSSFFAAVLFLPTNASSGGLLYAPFLIYKHFMESTSIISDYQWIYKLQTYEAHSNFLRIISLYGMAVAIFIIPSLGPRIFAVLAAPRIFLKKSWNFQNIFIGLIIAISFFVVSFFIQQTGNFNTIQFLWVSYIFLLIPTAYAVQIFDNRKSIQIILIILLVLSTIPSTIFTLRKYTSDVFKVDGSVVNLSRKISSLPGNALVMPIHLDIFPPETPSPFISAFSLRDVYYEPELTDFPGVKPEIERRKKVMMAVQSAFNSCTEHDTMIAQEILRVEKAGYVLQLKKGECEMDSKAFPVIAQEGNVTLYRMQE